MPVVKKIVTETGVLGLWELNESVSSLESAFQFSEAEWEKYRQFKSEKRKAEYLSTRLLTEALLGQKQEIEYHLTGKPELINLTHHITISHSTDLVAVFISEDEPAGIDVENINRNVDGITRRYLNDDEMNFTQSFENQQVGKILCWCAKESIFKCTPRAGILFNSHIVLNPFRLEKSGHFTGDLKVDGDIEKFSLWYFQYKNNLVVYCVPLRYNSGLKANEL